MYTSLACLLAFVVICRKVKYKIQNKNMQSVSQRIAGNMNATYMHPAHVPPTLAPSPAMPPSDSHNPTIAQMMQQAAERDERMTTLLEHISKSLSEE